MGKYNYVVCVCARWETESIVEWLVYYRHIGFDHIYLYCNDDDPREMYEEILPFIQGNEPYVSFFHFGLQGQQEQMYTHFCKNFINDCEWFCFFDVDEFLTLRKFANIDEFVKNMSPPPDAIHFHWVAAGNNGHKTRPPGRAIKNYNRRSNNASSFTKCLAKSKMFSERRLQLHVGGGWWHNIESILNDDSKIVDVRGEDMKGYYKDYISVWKHLSSDQKFHDDIIKTAFIYHISMKSEADLIRRVKRGVGGQFYGQVTWENLVNKGQQHVDEFLQQANVHVENHLIDVWESLSSKAYNNQIARKPSGTNIALGKPANQSSVSQWSLFQDTVLDAKNVVSGHLGERFQHHTAVESQPWWMVDLEETYRITCVYVYNRLDSLRDRLRNFTISGSLDGELWFDLYVKDDDISFGGVDGNPFIWNTHELVESRYVKITGHGVSHLDFAQVEIY